MHALFSANRVYDGLHHQANEQRYDAADDQELKEKLNQTHSVDQVADVAYDSSRQLISQTDCSTIQGCCTFTWRYSTHAPLASKDEEYAVLFENP